METEVKSLYDEVLTLKMAIEEAIIKGQKSFGALSDITESSMTSDEELGLIDVNGGSGLVGWVDDI
ncbi:hypothetical protein ACFLW7_01230 [Chloroflexota bacterium]